MSGTVLKAVGSAVLGTISFGAQMLSAQSSQTIHGFVSDSHCGATHSSPSAAASKCIKGCMKGGSEAVVVSDGKVYHLKGKTPQVAKYAGQNVTVTGTVDGDTLTVDSVTPEKS
jgi:Protein of unknown function (DUF5818)